MFGLAILALVPAARAVDKAAVQEKWRTPFDLYLDPREAFDMKSGDPEGVLFVDVRSRAELQFVGYPGIIDANIPIFLYEGYEWKQQPDGAHGRFAKHFNTGFVAAVDRLIAVRGKDRSTPIIVMCQSGSRAPIAARELHDAGYREVYTQYQGFEGIKAKQGPHQGKRMVNGWKLAGLPWIYRLETAKMYFNFAPGEDRAPQ
ncbi:MAG: rhodanese-like domain-containing protein [Gammaproteobacteria bacterium]